MALAEVVDAYSLRALTWAAGVGQVYFRSHGVGVTIRVFKRVSAAPTQHACFFKAILVGGIHLNAAQLCESVTYYQICITLALLARAHGRKGKCITGCAAHAMDDVSAHELSK